MITIRIDVEGARRKLDPVRFQRAVDRGMEGAAQYIRRVIATYPRARANSTYRRTGALGRSWQVRKQSDFVRQVYSRGVAYAPFVQGDQQRSFHAATGWLTTARVADEQANRAQSIVSNELRKEYAGDR